MFNSIKKARDRDQRGFTLIELLIVIVILGILAAIVVFAVGGITNNGTQSACQSDVKSIDTAAESYYAQQHAASASLAGLVSSGFLHTSGNISSNTDTANGGSGQANGYTVTFAPGTNSAPNWAGNATGTYGTGNTACS